MKYLRGFGFFMEHALTGFLRRFHPVSPAEEQLLADAFRARHFPEGETLVRSGQINRELFFICKGVLRIVMTTDDGTEVTHFFLKENQFCTIQNSFINQVPAPESIQAACNAEVLSITKTKLDLLYAGIPWLQPLIDRIIREALLDKIQLRNGYLGLDASARYKVFLSRQPEVAARVSQHDIATYLGMTQQSLSRIRRGNS